MKTFDSPNVRRDGQRWDLVLILLLALIFTPYVLTTFTTADEFTALGHAQRIAAGDVLYRDFFELIAPLSRWLPGLLFVVTGPSLLAARILQSGLLVLSGWQLSWLARRLGVPAQLALLPGLLLAVALYRLLPIYSHHWMVMPFELAALQAGFLGLEGRRRAWLAAGAASGLTALCMQSDGLVVLTALGLAAGTTAWWETGRFRFLGLFLGGVALPWAAAAGWLLAQGALGAAVTDVLLWTMAHYRVRGGLNDIKFLTDLSDQTSVIVHWVNLPYWYVHTFYTLYLFAFAPVLSLLLLAWGVDQLRGAWHAGTRLTLENEQLLLAAMMMGGEALLATRGRADWVHVGLYSVPAVLVGTAVACRWRRRLQATGLSLLGLLPLLSLAAFGCAGAVLDLQQFREAPERWLVWGSPDPRMAAFPAIRYLKTHGKPGDHIIGFPFGEIFSFYAWPTASSYSEMMSPGDLYHTAAEYDAFWAEMLARRPRFIVFEPFLPEKDVHASYFRQPLTGYKLTTVLPSPLDPPTRPAYIYEREK